MIHKSQRNTGDCLRLIVNLNKFCRTLIVRLFTDDKIFSLKTGR
jgi:hypothetical protein